MKREKFYPIPYYDSYGISTIGNIIDLNSHVLLKPIRKKGIYYVRINDKLLEIGKLVLNTFVGDVPGEIIYDKGNEFYDTRSIHYGVTTKKMNNNCYMINGIRFMKIYGYKYYFISSDGVIYSDFHDRFLVKSFNHKNYPTVNLVDDNGKRTPRKVHRLVYQTFIGKLDPKMIIDHKNGKKWCSSCWNLEQITQYENVNRAYDMNLNQGRWKNEQIEFICSLLEKNTPTMKILKLLGLKNSEFRDLTMLIHNILNKVYYTQISSKYKLSEYVSELNKKDRKLEIGDVKNIKHHLAINDMTVTELSKKFNVSISTISKIRDNKTWKNIRYEFNE